MNFVPATFDGTALHGPLGEVALPDAGAATRARKVIVAIRPEHFRTAEGAAGRPAGPIEAVVRAVESMGPDVYACFTLERDPARSVRFDERGAGADLAAADDLADAGLTAYTGDRIPMIARLDARSGIQEGAVIRLWYDAANIRIFDPASGTRLT